MQSSSPIWLTALLAVLAPLSALAGVWITQRNARKVADKRERFERLSLYAQQRRECYVQLLVSASSCLDAQIAWNSDRLETNAVADNARHDMYVASAAVRMLGSPAVIEAADNYTKAITRSFRRRARAEPLSHERRRELREAFEQAARADLPADAVSAMQS